MSIFKRGAPGVEWTQDDESTLPLRSVQPAESFPTQCAQCQGEIGWDGYCSQCGHKAKSVRDHFEFDTFAWVAGVCDIGLVHARNEDAMALHASETRAALVVCDGVTTSEDSDVASLAGARAACDVVWASNPQGTGTPSSRAAALEALLTKAVERANQAVIDATNQDSLNAAASTIAIAVIGQDEIACATLGDSRVYWLPDAGEPLQVTKDHSLAQDEMDLGVPRLEAESSAGAHTITGWLGRDAIDLVPHSAVLPRDEDGWLLVCSDGLWNYASEASALRDVVDRFRGDDSSAWSLADQLVAWANEQGGHDNITAMCARLLTSQGSAPLEPEMVDEDCEGANEEPEAV